jgi:hypothetical protein
MAVNKGMPSMANSDDDAARAHERTRDRDTERFHGNPDRGEPPYIEFRPPDRSALLRDLLAFVAHTLGEKTAWGGFISLDYCRHRKRLQVEYDVFVKTFDDYTIKPTHGADVYSTDYCGIEVCAVKQRARK